MKPEWCPQEVWDEVDEQVLCSEEVFGKVSLTFEESDILRLSIARALLDAHQRGRREGLEEAATIVEVDNRSDLAKAYGYEPNFHVVTRAIASAIRAKAQEVSS